MSDKLQSEVEWLHRVRSGFRYMATVHSQVGTLVYRALHVRDSYSSRSLRLRHWDTTGGQVTLTDDENKAVVPVYDFGFIHNLYHMADTDPESVVLAAWYLVAHEWGHYYLAKADKRNQERDADAFAERVMGRVGFDEEETAVAEDQYWIVFNDDKRKKPSRQRARRSSAAAK
ncbi:hypothetical protein K8S17_05735 [bacterium]|nr:hypothetical protein [bacterium]